MRIRREVSPAAAPIGLLDLVHGVLGTLREENYLVKLQAEIKQFFGFSDVFLVSSGKAALFLVLQALRGLSSRSEVLIPAYTCFSVPSAVIKAGLQVRLCDVNVETLDFDFGMLEKLVGPKTLCVVPTHLFGIPADMERVNRICRAQGVVVVEDAAQAMGVRCRERYLGAHGDVGFFSLGRGKQITCGSGGIIGTNSAVIAEALKQQFALLKRPGMVDNVTVFFQLLLMSVLIHPALYWLPASLPFLGLGQTVFYKDFPVKRLSGMQAGLLKHWRAKLSWSNEMRMKTASYFCERLRLKVIGRGPLPYLRLPVLVDDGALRERILQLSKKRGLGISGMYPSAVSQIRQVKESLEEANLPGAVQVTKQLLTLPTHYLLSERDKAAICQLAEVVMAPRLGRGIEPETIGARSAS